MLIRKERFAGRDRADPREPCANDVECGGRVGNGGVCWSRAKVEGSIERKKGGVHSMQPRCGYSGCHRGGGGMGQMGHWGMGAGIKKEKKENTHYCSLPR